VNEMPVKLHPRLLIFALVGMTYLTAIAQIEGIPDLFVGYVALLPVQLGALGYMWYSGRLRFSKSR
jgi:hypothetical protein